MKFSEWLEQSDDYGIWSPPMTNDEAWGFIIEYLLPDDWYSVNPLPQPQINPEILNYILRKYSKGYKREMTEYYRKCRGIPTPKHEIFIKKLKKTISCILLIWKE